MRRNTLFFYLEWPEGIVPIPVGQPEPVNTPAQFCERSTVAKKRLKNLLYKTIILISPRPFVRNFFQLIQIFNFPLAVNAAQHNIFYLE